MDDLIKLLDKNLDYVSHEIIEDTMYINCLLYTSDAADE